ncbi:MAG: DUF2147 domain-containing protein [Cyclobacteriaceae bacterium]
MKYLLLIGSLFSLTLTHAQGVLGKWKTIDDQTGKARSIVEIVERDGKVYGSIVQLFRSPEEDPDPICELCPGDRKDQKVIGMEIIREMVREKSSGEYEDGEILDPESGDVYDCKIWLDESGNLKVRGYIMFLYRTQTWLPYRG